MTQTVEIQAFRQSRPAVAWVIALFKRAICSDSGLNTASVQVPNRITFSPISEIITTSLLNAERGCKAWRPLWTSSLFRAMPMTPSQYSRSSHSRIGFTLIELLVVISIIALLIGILLPTLGQARKVSQAMNSLANVRSWGQGTHTFLNDHKFVLPWEGEKQDILSNYNQSLWWGNSIPPYVGQTGYAELFVNSYLAGKPVPQPPDKNIFIDPSAVIGEEQLGHFTLKTLPYYFSYAWNADLAEGNIKPIKINGLDRLHYDAIPQPSIAILFFELRANANELDFLGPADPGYAERSATNLLRMKGDEQHFAGRHFKGGHLAYADGHAKHRGWLESYTADDWAADGTAGD